jgi:hypothetical protein
MAATKVNPKGISARGELAPLFSTQTSFIRARPLYLITHLQPKLRSAGLFSFVFLFDYFDKN